MKVPMQIQKVDTKWYAEQIAKATAKIEEEEAKLAALDSSDKLYLARQGYIAMNIANLRTSIEGWKEKVAKA